MKHIYYTRLSAEEILSQRVVNIDVTVSDEEYIFVYGEVYSPEGKLLPNCAIAVYAVDSEYIPVKRKLLGATFSNEKGSYGMSLLRDVQFSYELLAYSTL